MIFSVTKAYQSKSALTKDRGNVTIAHSRSVCTDAGSECRAKDPSTGRAHGNGKQSNMNFGKINDRINRLIVEGKVNADIGVATKSIPVEIISVSRHAAKQMRERGITNEMAQSYIDNSEVMLIQGASTQTYLSSDGVSAVVVENGMLKTAYSREYFDPAIKQVFEVIENG
jgi:hypothetical protein